ELDDVLLALRVDDVVPQTAVRHERGVLNDVAGALEEVARGEAPEHETGSNAREILLAERRARFEIRPEDVEGGRRNRRRFEADGHGRILLNRSHIHEGATNMKTRRLHTIVPLTTVGIAALVLAAHTHGLRAEPRQSSGGSMALEQNKATARRWSEELWGRGNLAVADEIIAR